MKNNKLFSKILLISFGFLMFLSAESIVKAETVTMNFGETREFGNTALYCAKRCEYTGGGDISLTAPNLFGCSKCRLSNVTYNGMVLITAKNDSIKQFNVVVPNTSKSLSVRVGESLYLTESSLCTTSNSAIASIANRGSGSRACSINGVSSGTVTIHTDEVTYNIRVDGTNSGNKVEKSGCYPCGNSTLSYRYLESGSNFPNTCLKSWREGSSQNDCNNLTGTGVTETVPDDNSGTQNNPSTNPNENNGTPIVDPTANTVPYVPQQGDIASVIPVTGTNDLNDALPSPTSFTQNGVCNDFVIRKTSKALPYYTFSTGSVGKGYAVKYRATSFCVDSNGVEYPSMCLDPALLGPSTSGTRYGSDGYVDMESKFGRAIYNLYINYYKGNAGNEGVIAQVTQAARILEAYWTDDDYAFLGKTNGIYRRDIMPYENYAAYMRSSGSNAGIAVYSTGGLDTSLVNEMVASSVAYANNSNLPKPHTVEVNLSKTNDSTSEDGSFVIEAGLTISGMSSSVNLNDGDFTFVYTNEDGENIADTFEEQLTLISSDASTRAYNLVITGTTDQCKLKVQVKVKYNDPDDVRNIVILRSKTQTEMQRFLTFLNGDIVSGDSMSIGFGGASCQNNKCVTVEGFECIDDASVAYVIEGKEQTSASVDWEACILDKKDPGGNSYTVQEKVQATVNGTTSTYCTVSCKEDFAFKMPGNLGEVKQGRYISINLDGQYHAVAGVAAQRTCVSSKIANTTYEKDAVVLKKEMLEYLNAYSYYKAMYESLDSDEARKYYGDGERGYGHNTWHVAEAINASDDPSKGHASYSGNIGQYFGYYQEFTNYTHSTIKYNKYKFENSGNDKATIISNIIIDKSNLSITTGTAFERNLTSGTDTTGVVPEFSETIADKEGPYTFTYEDNCHDIEDPLSGNVTGRECDDEEGKTTYEIKSLDEGTDKMAKYNETVAQVKAAYEGALASYNSTRATLESITQKINICTTWGMEYNFNPEITFSYDETSYMEMMASNNKLVALNEVERTEERHYCTSDPGSISGILGCSSDSSSGLRAAAIPDELVASDSPAAAPTSTPINYYSFARIGMIDRFGNPGVDIMGGKSGAQEFVYYRSNSVFYSYPQNGIVTLNKDHDNATILDIDDPNRGSNEPDGYVYPIAITTPVGVYQYRLTYKNIGQFFNSNRGGGRVMGDDGYLFGIAQNEYVCVYNVCAFDDPTCGDDSSNSCVDILNSKVCNYGGFNNNSTLTEIEKTQYQACAEALLNSDEDCCKYVNESFIGIGVSDKYNEVCKLPNACTGFKIIDGVTNISDSANINDDGRLQFTVKSVSLDNLFPNDNPGINWNTGTGHKATSEIEGKGESVYATPQYSYTLTPNCMAVIREYNAQAEGAELGFADYTLISSDNGKKDNSTFLNALEQNGCIVNARDEGGN